MSASVCDEVLLERSGNKGVITLNRPKALNALNYSMITKIYSHLKSWDTDSTLDMIVIKGLGGKAFSSGADVKAIALEGKGSPLSDQYFRDEYSLNNQISSLSIPYVALIDGICMGGGVGLSVHGSFRVVTEKAVFAMPETAIGFFPDIGSSYFLNRLPAKLGLFLALTGYRLTGRDIFDVGIATHFVPSNGLTELESELMRLESPDFDSVEHVLTKYQKQFENDFIKESSLKPFIEKINASFGEASSVEQIIENLKKDTSEWAAKQVQTLNRLSPTSLMVTFELLKRGQSLSLAECLKLEFRVCQRFMESNDFYSGVRAVLIEKHNSPVWNPLKLSEVSEERVQSFFAPLTENISELQI